MWTHSPTHVGFMCFFPQRSFCYITVIYLHTLPHTSAHHTHWPFTPTTSHTNLHWFTWLVCGRCGILLISHLHTTHARTWSSPPDTTCPLHITLPTHYTTRPHTHTTVPAPAHTFCTGTTHTYRTHTHTHNHTPHHYRVVRLVGTLDGTLRGRRYYTAGLLVRSIYTRTPPYRSHATPHALFRYLIYYTTSLDVSFPRHTRRVTTVPPYLPTYNAFHHLHTHHHTHVPHLGFGQDWFWWWWFWSFYKAGFWVLALNPLTCVRTQAFSQEF